MGCLETLLLADPPFKATLEHEPSKHQKFSWLSPLRKLWRTTEASNSMQSTTVYRLHCKSQDTVRSAPPFCCLRPVGRRLRKQQVNRNISLSLSFSRSLACLLAGYTSCQSCSTLCTARRLHKVFAMLIARDSTSDWRNLLPLTIYRPLRFQHCNSDIPVS